MEANVTVVIVMFKHVFEVCRFRDLECERLVGAP
jgi:hypothetical protein